VYIGQNIDPRILKKFIQTNNMTRPKTIFLDIDGTLVSHLGSIEKQFTESLQLLPGTLEKLSEWDRKGYNIILTTGRRESTRKRTEEQLAEKGIYYDQLIMGIGGGTRILINDKKPDRDDETAISLSLKRNEGISEVYI
jgi:ribonucleotide monophosphatase NagD (HAD superfamily)